MILCETTTKREREREGGGGGGGGKKKNMTTRIRPTLIIRGASIPVLSVDVTRAKLTPFSEIKRGRRHAGCVTCNDPLL